MDAAQVRELFDYDPETGLLRWRIAISSHKPGEVAGRSKAHRYIEIRFEGRWYTGHRLAFAWMEGRWPDPEVDHKNGDKLDNRWSNLREATKSQQAANRKLACTNKVGLKGVIRVTRYGVTKFEARLRIDGKQHHLGRFETAQEAHAAYVVAAEKYHGQFARGA